MTSEKEAVPAARTWVCNGPDLCTNLSSHKKLAGGGHRAERDIYEIHESQFAVSLHQ